MLNLIVLVVLVPFFMYFSKCLNPIEKQLEMNSDFHLHELRMDAYLWAVIVLLTCFSFLRTSYNDTENYIWIFLTSPSLKEGYELGTYFDWTGNPLFSLYQDVIHSFTNNFHIYFFFPALAISYAVVILIKRYSVNPAFSMLVFFAIGTYVMYIAAMKQSIAMFILILSLPYAEKKQYVRFCLLVALAILFHTHSFMFFLIIFMFDKPWRKTTWLLLGLTIFGMLTYDFTFGGFMEFAISIGANVAEIEVFDGHQINFLRVAVYWVPVLIALFFKKQLFENTSRMENLFVNMSIVSAFILTLGLVQGANLFARMAAYFEIGVAIAVPWMIHRIFEKHTAKIVTVIAMVAYSGYFLYEHMVSKNIASEYQMITIIEFWESLL